MISVCNHKLCLFIYCDSFGSTGHTSIYVASDSKLLCCDHIFTVFFPLWSTVCLSVSWKLDQQGEKDGVTFLWNNSPAPCVDDCVGCFPSACRRKQYVATESFGWAHTVPWWHATLITVSWRHHCRDRHVHGLSLIFIQLMLMMFFLLLFSSFFIFASKKGTCHLLIHTII